MPEPWKCKIQKLDHMQAFQTSSNNKMAVKTIWKVQRPLHSPLNRHFSSLNLHQIHWSTIIKLLRAQDLEYLLCVSFPQSSKKRPYFFASATFGFYQYLCYDLAITMIDRGNIINKMANVYKKTFPVGSKNGFIALLWVSYCWYLNVL